MRIRKNLTKVLVLSIFMFTLVFTPSSVEASSNYKIGALLKIKGLKGAAVYQIGSDGKKYIYPDQKTFNTWHDNFSEVLEVALEELDDIDDGGTVTFQAGTRLITHRNTAKVYTVGEDGELVHIPDEGTARRFYGNTWYQLVLDIDPGLFAVSYKIRNGMLSEDNLPEGSLIEEEDTGEYFLIEDGQRRRVTEEALRLRNLIRKNIIKLKRLSSLYDDGDEIDDDEDIEDFDIGKGSEKIMICHKPDVSNKTIRVSIRSLRAHLAHGDTRGACVGDEYDDDDDDDDNDSDDDDDTEVVDITVSDIMIDPSSPIVNATTTITVYIKNSGDITLTDTTGILNGLVSFEDFISTASSTVPVISEAEPFEADDIVSIVWEGYFTTSGEKTLEMIADESDELEESDETNNTYSETFTVLEETIVLPDITVDDIVVDPASPIANATSTPVTITVYIKNSGDITLTDTTGILNGLVFFEDFEETASSTTPIISEAEPFEADDIVSIVWEGYFTTSGEKTLEMIADESDELEESDETNNTYSETVTIIEEVV